MGGGGWNQFRFEEVERGFLSERKGEVIRSFHVVSLAGAATSIIFVATNFLLLFLS